MENNNLKFDFNDSTLYVSLIGEIDHHSAVKLRNDVDAEIYSRKPKKVIVELSEVKFRDSSGLGFLMGKYSLIQKLRGTLSVANPNARTLRMIQLAGFDRLIKVEYPDKAEGCGEVPSKVYEDKVSLSQTSEEHMINEMKIQLPSLSVNESVAREVCAMFCTQLNPNAEEHEDIKSAVSAAVTNCVLLNCSRIKLSNDNYVGIYRRDIRYLTSDALMLGADTTIAINHNKASPLY